MELPCKFSEEGCKVLGARAAMQNHVDGCKYRRNINCPVLNCKVKTSAEKIVYHLRNIHKALECRIEAPGKVKEIYWQIDQIEYSRFVPLVAIIEGRTFLLNFTKRNFTSFVWVSIVGTENDAQRYEAKMIVAPRDEATSSYMIKGKVYSIEENMNDVLRDGDGVMEVGRIMVEKMGKMVDGNMRLYIDYHIAQK